MVDIRLESKMDSGLTDEEITKAIRDSIEGLGKDLKKYSLFLLTLPVFIQGQANLQPYTMT